MTQDVAFKGLACSPSDNSAQDGELGTCLNLVPEDGELRPIAQPEVVDDSGFLTEGVTIEYVHKVSYDNDITTHYICYNSKTDIWFWHIPGETDEDWYPIRLPGDGEFHVNSVTSIGNILCFVGDDDIWYAFWDSDTDIYKMFNQSDFRYKVVIQTPEQNPRVFMAEMGDDFWDVFNWSSFGTTDESARRVAGMSAKGLTTALSAIDAKMQILVEAEKREWFKNVVFGVAALRLYDGSYINVSNIFLLPAYKIGNVLSFDADASLGQDTKGPAISLYSTLHKHNVKVTIDLDGIGEFVQGVDIFCSNGDFFLNQEMSYSARDIEYPSDGSHRAGSITLERLKGNDICKKIDNLTFYLSASIRKEDLGKDISLKNPIGTETAMTLVDLRRTRFGASTSYVYNNRLHLADVRVGVFEAFDFNPSLSFDISSVTELYTNDYANCRFFGSFPDLPIQDGKYTTADQTCEICSVIYFKGHTVRLHEYSQYPLPPIITYPASDALRAELYLKYNEGYYKKEISLYSADNVNWSFYVNTDDEGVFALTQINDVALIKGTVLEATRNGQWEDIDCATWESVAKSCGDKQITSRSPSLIKVSEAENPLVFPSSNSVQVGTSVIKAMAANTRPITEGQFGDAPLYVFTDEGTWMLMLSAEGKYQARQPVNRDICSNPKGILQTDDAVLFPTERGIMMQEGSTSKLITDVLDGTVFDYTQLYKEDYSRKVLAAGDIPEDAVRYIPFRRFMQGADMVYDYYDGRVIVFNPNCAYAYVYSLKSGMWGTMECDIKKRINIYPEAYAIDGDNRIVDLYQSQPTDAVRYFLCTRPMSISGAEVYKTMFSCIARGYFRNEAGKCGMALYGSNDLFRWFPISTSVDKYLRGMCGSPYKYFRLALTGSLLPDERLGGLSAEFQERWQNKLR